MQQRNRPFWGGTKAKIELAPLELQGPIPVCSQGNGKTSEQATNQRVSKRFRGSVTRSIVAEPYDSTDRPEVVHNLQLQRATVAVLLPDPLKLFDRT